MEAQARTAVIEALRILDTQVDEIGRAQVDALARGLGVDGVLRTSVREAAVAHAGEVRALIAEASSDPDPRVVPPADEPGADLVVLVRSCHPLPQAGTDIDDRIGALLGCPVSIVGVDDVQPAYRERFARMHEAGTPLREWLSIGGDAARSTTGARPADETPLV